MFRPPDTFNLDDVAGFFQKHITWHLRRDCDRVRRALYRKTPAAPSGGNTGALLPFRPKMDTPLRRLYAPNSPRAPTGSVICWGRDSQFGRREIARTRCDGGRYKTFPNYDTLNNPLKNYILNMGFKECDKTEAADIPPKTKDLIDQQEKEENDKKKLKKTQGAEQIKAPIGRHSRKRKSPKSHT